MKHLNSNNIVEITATSENENFPASRLLDTYPSRKYRAVSGEWRSELTLYIVGGVSDVIIVGTNAASASLTVDVAGVMGWGDSMSFGDSVTHGEVASSATGSATQDVENKSLLVALSESVTGPCIVNLVLFGPSAETLEAGVIVARIAETYGGKNPKYGLSKSQQDYSVKAENSNGSRYYKQGDIVRVFGLQALMTRANTRVLASFFKTNGENPSGWQLTDENSNDFVVYARMDGPPNITDSYPNHSEVSWRLVEVI